MQQSRIASTTVAPSLPMSFDQQFAQVQACITERKEKDLEFKRLTQEKAATIHALYKSIENVFRTVKETPSKKEFAKRFFHCSYIAAVVVPFDLENNPLFKSNNAVLDKKEPLSQAAFEKVMQVVCKRIRFFVDRFFATEKTSTIKGFLEAMGPSAEHILFQFSQVEDVGGRQKCYYVVDYER